MKTNITLKAKDESKPVIKEKRDFTIDNQPLPPETVKNNDCNISIKTRISKA